MSMPVKGDEEMEKHLIEKGWKCFVRAGDGCHDLWYHPKTGEKAHLKEAFRLQKEWETPSTKSKAG